MYRVLFIIIGFTIFEAGNSFVIRKKNETFTNMSPLSHKGVSKTDKLSRRRFIDEKDEQETENSLESVVFAINTGVKELISGKTNPDLIDSIAQSLVEFAKNNAEPIYRTKGQEYNIKPEIIHFRSDKPSVMFEINSKSIVKLLKDILQSKIVAKYMDKFSREAAIIYRAVKQQLDKAESKRKRE